MKKILIVLLFLFSLKAHASQLLIGLFSENIVAWNIWEYKDGVLQHHLLLFNKGKSARELQIKQKSFKAKDTSFEVVPTDVTFHQLSLDPGQLVKVAYPQRTDEARFMEFFENRESIGMLEIREEEPAKAFVDKKYGFYSNEGINSGPLGYWVKLKSIHDPKTEVVFGFDLKLSKKEHSQLIKVLKHDQNIPQDQSDLAVLKAADKTIIEISQPKSEAVFNLDLNPEEKSFQPVFLFSNHFENRRMFMSAMKWIGIFPAS